MKFSTLFHVVLVLCLTVFALPSFAQKEELPTVDNSPAIRELTFFGTELNVEKKTPLTYKEYRDVLKSLEVNPSINFETYTQLETILYQAFKNQDKRDIVNEKIAEAIGVVKEAYVQNNPLAKNTMASSSNNPLWLQAPITSAQSSPYIPYPSYLGMNLKDQLEFCNVATMADDVLNTNYKELNLQLQKRYANKSLDEIADIIINQRAFDTASLATISSSAAFGASLAAYYMPATLGGAGKGLVIKAGKPTLITAAAAVTGTLMYYDICYYMKQNARMIYQLADLYDTGAFYTLDEKQINSSVILFSALGFKVGEKFLIENVATRNVGALTKDLWYNIRNRTGQFFQFMFENAASGIRKGVDSARMAASAEIGKPPSVTPGGPSIPSKPGLPAMPVPGSGSGAPGIGAPGIGYPSPNTPSPEVDVTISKISPWAVLAVPANAAITYTSMQGVGRTAIQYIKDQARAVYQLPMQIEYQQEAVLKLLILVGINSQPAPEMFPPVPPTTIPTIPTAPTVPNNPESAQFNPPPGFPLNPTLPSPTNPQPVPTVPTEPFPTPTQLVLKSPEQRIYILNIFDHYNPDGQNSQLRKRIVAEMDKFNFQSATDVFQQVFTNELADNVTAKMAVIKSAIELLYLDGNFSAQDFTIIENIRLKIMGLTDKQFANNILRLKYHVENEKAELIRNQQ